MSSSWDDFKQDCDSRLPKVQELREEKTSKVSKNEEDASDNCYWGQKEAQNEETGQDLEESESAKFIATYEKYLKDKKAFMDSLTENHSMYANNPQRALREWLDNEGHELKIKTDQPKENQYICSIDIPVEEHDFNITSQVNSKKQLAIDEICMVACKLLDECKLLYSWQNSSNKDSSNIDKKRQFKEANKEDDIELDSTCSKRHCNLSPLSAPKHGRIAKVNTYDSLMADWKELNMSILLLKAKLVKLDLSVTKRKPAKNSDSIKASGCQGTNEVRRASESSRLDGGGADDDDVDPLDEFMSSLDTKTELSMDERIEKTRIKSQIAAFESKQAELSRLIELAKPELDSSKSKSKRQ